ncbi:MAG: GIY-YIG nuclease family protein [Bacteriovoracaceae bacterium]|nr:GIY-YIG nuclease family protein [Bacteriovoracaceae bacterium]
MSKNLKKYSIIDIETTGGSARANKVIEIAIVNIDGDKIVDTYSTLIYPERRIPPQISYLTGITEDMVAGAPKFYEVAKKIVQMTEDRIFVAHNVHFDYSFIQHEFRELGFTYKRELLCTVRLSRKIIPGLASYSLGKLCKDVGIDLPEKDRHRAMGDAKATAELFQMIQKKKSEEFSTIFNNLNAKINYPPFFEENDYEELPNSPGVYYLWDKRGKLLYIGKAKDIKKRVRQHFMVKSSRTKEYEFKNGMANISFQETGNELAALLLEASEIKSRSPMFNKALRRKYFPWSVIPYETTDGVLEFRVAKIKDPDYPIRCGSRRSAEATISRIYQKAFGLESELNFENNLRLMQSTLGVDNYNAQLRKRYDALTYSTESFQIKLAGRSKKEQCFIKRFESGDLHLVYTKEGEVVERFELEETPDLVQITLHYLRKKEIKVTPLAA